MGPCEHLPPKEVKPAHEVASIQGLQMSILWAQAGTLMSLAELLSSKSTVHASLVAMLNGGAGDVPPTSRARRARLSTYAYGPGDCNQRYDAPQGWNPP